MFSNSTYPQGPLYDPDGRIRNFIFEEDFGNIRYDLLGTGKLYNDPAFAYYLGTDKEWRRSRDICRNPYFIREKPSRFDALQGIEGDCWVVAAMDALTLNDSLIRHVVPLNQSFDRDYTGAFHFRIWQLGTWKDVVVDDKLPVFKKNKKLCFVHSKSQDVFWACLLEKAYAKVYGTRTVTYENLSSGTAMTSMQDFSGGIVERVQTKALPSGLNIKFFLNDLLNNDIMICCLANKKTTASIANEILVNHTYYITRVFKCSDDDPDYPGLYLVRLMNPWGRWEWKGDWCDDDYDHWRQIDREIKEKLNVVKEDDGEFWMNEIDFLKYFENMWICHLGPGRYLQSRQGDKFNTWKTVCFRGEWVKNVSAGGYDLFRYQNPQYKIKLEWPQNDSNRDNFSVVVIELTHRSKLGRKFRPNVAFYVYSLKGIANTSLRMEREFFKQHRALNENDVKFYMSDGRAYLMSFRLEYPGEYLVVPCTHSYDEESEFLLRVFTESTVKTYEWDFQLSKTFLLKETSFDENDIEIESIFKSVADGKNEINWMGLQYILETVLNKNRYNLPIVAKIVYIFYNNVYKTIVYTDNNERFILCSKGECRSMIAMLDVDQSGKLDYTEFRFLWNKICFWTEVYEHHKDETEGLLSVSQLRDALSSVGYDVDTRTVHSRTYIYANERRLISLSDFIICGIILERVNSFHSKKHVANGGSEVTFTLEDWVKSILIL